MKHDRWDQKDLERRLCHALDIAKRTVERLATQGYTDPHEPNDSVCPEKIVSETALLLLAASKAAASSVEVRSRLQHVARLLIPHARSERIYLGVCLKPALALDFASAHICLARLGYPDAGFDALLREALHSQARRGRERAPHRMLEHEWLLGNWSVRSDSCRRRASAVRDSVLNFPMDLLDGTRDDVYAFTHALMYATDFNINPRRLPRGRAEILAEADAALARCLDEEDYDLAGEVLLTWPLTGKSWSAAAAFGFRILARVEDQAGFLPAPITRIQRLNELAGDRRTDYLFATAYHTIYVMGLLCAAALQPGRIPPARVPSGTVAPGSSNRILEMLDGDKRRPHWREEFEQLKQEERDALAGFLLIIALRRKTRQRDFGAVARLLHEGHAMGLTDTPAASQAAEMLERLAIFAESTSLRRSA